MKKNTNETALFSGKEAIKMSYFLTEKGCDFASVKVFKRITYLFTYLLNT